MKTYQLWIDGKPEDPAKGEWIDTVNPYTGRVLGKDSSRDR